MIEILLISVVFFSLAILAFAGWSFLRIYRNFNRTEIQLQANEKLIRELDKDLRSANSQLRESITTQLSHNQQAQSSTIHLLRENLIEQFGQLKTAMEQRLGNSHKELTIDAAKLRETLLHRFENLQKEIADNLAQGREKQQLTLTDHSKAFELRQSETLRTLQEVLQNGLITTQRQVVDSLGRHSEELGKRVDSLTQLTERKLKEISGQVEKRLEEGFKKTTETFTSVLTHLTRIDEAQKKITELSSNVISLQEILADKRSRGAYGEVQLAGLVRNLMSENDFKLQYTLSNKKLVDCMLFLPKPTGNVAIDAKFPLENYQRMLDIELGDNDRKDAKSLFRQDIKKHIQDIADKYILPPETSDGAVMFIPAEAIFAEIHAHFSDLVQEAYKRKVWLVSPSTLMAILNTARMVLKDAATKEQIHIIQKHLVDLSGDFQRFQKRMDNLSKHIQQAGKDVEEVNTSARRITSRFEKIERVEIEQDIKPRLVVVEKKGNEIKE